MERLSLQLRARCQGPGSGSLQLLKVLASDCVLAALSVLFVAAYLALYTRSLALAGWGLLSILLSFPATLFVYRVLLQVRELIG